MKKIILGFGLISLLTMTYFIFTSNKVDYTKTVMDEVITLKEELADIESDLVAGKLSSNDAKEAQSRIINRLNNINKAVESSNKVQLSDAQRSTLINGLASLKQTLTRYRATLVNVEETVAKAEAQKNKRQVKSNYIPISEVLSDTVDLIEETSVELAEEYEDIIDEISDVIMDDSSVEKTVDIEGVSEDDHYTDNEEPSVEERGDDVPSDDINSNANLENLDDMNISTTSSTTDSELQ